MSMVGFPPSSDSLAIYNIIIFLMPSVFRSLSRC